MKTLLVYYHPIVWDLAKTFQKMGHEVTVAVNTNIKDNYGTGHDIIKKEKAKNLHTFDIIPLTTAVALLNANRFDFMGCDGVFDGDKLVMDLCNKKNVPYFCISGYPGVMDEPSENILSFGWTIPTFQYANKYPSEGHRKMVDWREIVEKGRSQTKNMCVFYPQLWYMRSFLDDNQTPLTRPELVSGIQRYEECNEWNFKLFKKLQENVLPISLVNYEGVSHDEFLKKVQRSRGLVHLKQADQPGISVLEAMRMSTPVITMKSFVLASHNQDLLIDGYNSVVADSYEELIERVALFDLPELGYNAKKHSEMLCSFKRQRYKLDQFIDRCFE